MNFRQLEAFIYVIKYRSFSKAAETIYISQPTVSIHINALEEELGVPLIIRGPKGIFPTEAGKNFYNYAMQITQLRDKSVEEIKKFSSNVGGSLEIAASTVPAQYVIPEVLPKLMEQYPNIFFTVMQQDTAMVIEKVESMEVELGIGGSRQEKSNCDFMPFYNDELIVIAPNTPQYQKMQGNITYEQLQKLPFISRERGSGTRNEMESYLQKQLVNPKKLHIITQMQSSESVKQAVKNGMGISVVSRLAVQDYIEFGSVLPLTLEGASMRRPLYIISRKKRPFSKQAEIFVSYLRNYYSQVK